MKKITLLTAILAFGILLTMTNCRKKKIDPCDRVECDRGEKCVKGKCVPIRKD